MVGRLCAGWSTVAHTCPREISTGLKEWCKGVLCVANFQFERHTSLKWLALL